MKRLIMIVCTLSFVSSGCSCGYLAEYPGISRLQIKTIKDFEKDNKQTFCFALQEKDSIVAGEAIDLPGRNLLYMIIDRQGNEPKIKYIYNKSLCDWKTLTKQDKLSKLQKPKYHFWYYKIDYQGIDYYFNYKDDSTYKKKYTKVSKHGVASL